MAHDRRIAAVRLVYANQIAAARRVRADSENLRAGCLRDRFGLALAIQLVSVNGTARSHQERLGCFRPGHAFASASEAELDDLATSQALAVIRQPLRRGDEFRIVLQALKRSIVRRREREAKLRNLVELRHRSRTVSVLRQAPRERELDRGMARGKRRQLP